MVRLKRIERTPPDSAFYIDYDTNIPLYKQSANVRVRACNEKEKSDYANPEQGFQQKKHGAMIKNQGATWMFDGEQKLSGTDQSK
jgi:hypothetical protein